jgi:cell division protein FtsB
LNVIDGDMEKLREIYVFVCFALGVVALILCVFQAWNGKIGSASALGVAFVICGVFLFLSQIKTFKVWEVQVELRDTLDRAEEIIGRVRKLAAISARASYLTIAWGNRLGTPPAREKQAVFDEIDSQLAELKVSPKELADIQRPFVKMVRLDFFFLFKGVLSQYATILNTELVADVHAAKDPNAAGAVLNRHAELITAWTKRTQKEDPSADLEKESLADALNEYMPKAGEWLNDKELAVMQKFKAEILRLNADCEKKGGYTPEAVTYYDRYSPDHNIKAKQLRNEVLQ